MSVKLTKAALDSLIDKSRVHLYKPIQIAEILYRDRVQGDIKLENLESYRNASKSWPNIVTERFVGRISNSSARYQDDVFNENAIPPRIIAELGVENRLKEGVVETYIYRRFSERFSQMSSALDYCTAHDCNTFNVNEFLDLFWHNPGLRRSIDKIYEIVVYALFSILVERIGVKITIGSEGEKATILEEFADFTEAVTGLPIGKSSITLPAKIYRVGLTNAADRGLDMYANYGMAIQIKHLTLKPELAKNIVGSITADRIVIVCIDAEQEVITSLLSQIGWQSRIQSIVTQSQLVNWYGRALRGIFSAEIGSAVLAILKEQILAEFPASDNGNFKAFYEGRNYHLRTDIDWM